MTAAIKPLHGMQLHDLLWQNMRDAGNVLEFAPVVDWLDIGPDTMEKWRQLRSPYLQQPSISPHCTSLQGCIGSVSLSRIAMRRPSIGC